MQITSRDNSLLRQARLVRDGKVTELIYVEGLRLAEEALKSKLEIEAVIFSEELARKDRAESVIDELSSVSKRVGSVSEKLLESISYTKTPQGIVVLARRPSLSSKELEVTESNPLYVVLHQVNNPVNVGAIVRSAEAVGATAIITTPNTCDPFSPKSLRGAMGSAFRVPVWQDIEFAKVIDWCKSNGITSICSDAGATTDHTAVDWTGPSALILGPESNGLSEEEISLAAQTVRIPMMGEVESLNVSVAAGVLLFEAARQRRLTQP